MLPLCCVHCRVSADNVHKLEGDCYCSKSCGSFIEQLAAQLVNPLDRIQPDALQQYLAQPSHRPKQAVAAQGGGVTTMKSLIQVSRAHEQQGQVTGTTSCARTAVLRMHAHCTIW